MTNNEIKTLNSATKTLIDSCKGYETCCDISDDSYALKSEFMRRKQERESLVNQFQSQVRSLGGEPEDDGSMTGSVHRGFTRFTSLFTDDETAAISALDDGEEYLAEKLADCLDCNELSPRSRELLQQAHQSAKSGERFAERLETTV